jgi:hypothetical protein
MRLVVSSAETATDMPLSVGPLADAAKGAAVWL